jgi:chromosome segregation ATPase
MSENEDSLENLLKNKDLAEKNIEMYTKVQQELDEKTSELQDVRTKLDAVSAQLDEKNTECATLTTTCDKDKEMIAVLTQQVEDLRASNGSMDRQIAEKDAQIKEALESITSINTRIEDSLAKVPGLQDDIIRLQDENERLKVREKELQFQVQEANEKYEMVKTKFRESGDSVLGTTMELERAKSVTQEKEQEISDLQEKLGSMLSGTSGVITDREKMVEIFQLMLSRVTRSIRICIPEAHMIEDDGLLSMLQKYPNTVLVNLASDFKPTDEHIVLDLKSRNMQVTHYDQKNRWVLNRDGTDAVVAIQKSDDTVLGFYSDEPMVVSMFNSVIMEPFIKGMKII